MPRKTSKKQVQYFYDITVDLHGYILEDAILELERIIYAGKYNSALIIHGRGKGILKDGLRKYLRESNYIKEFYPGENLNIPGSDGVTVVYM